MFSTICLSRGMKVTLNIVRFLFEVCGIYLFWIILHFSAANLYPKYCALPTLIGFIESPFQVMSPHCVALRWIINTGGNIMTQMWFVLGTWITGKIFTSFFSDSKNLV